MGYLGNLAGPRESEIVEKLGPEYFGIDWERLETDIEWFKDTERRGEIIPVHVDENGEPYITLSSTHKKDQRFYLRRAGYQLSGEIKTFTKDEGERWERKETNTLRHK